MVQDQDEQNNNIIWKSQGHHFPLHSYSLGLMMKYKNCMCNLTYKHQNIYSPKALFWHYLINCEQEYKTIFLFL